MAMYMPVKILSETSMESFAKEKCATAGFSAQSLPNSKTPYPQNMNIHHSKVGR